MALKAAERPSTLLLAAVVLGLEAVALLAATVANVIDITAGHTWQVANGLALVVFQLCVAGGVGLLANGVLKLRPWTRTPAVMLQVLVVAVAVFLLQAHQYAWGIPVLVLGAAGLAGLLAPASLKALAREIPSRR